jgi:hypothetical protein
MNKIFAICYLLVTALSFGKISQFGVILAAIKDGEAEKLGTNPQYPLH